MNVKIESHQRNIEARKKGVSKWLIPSVEKRKFISFINELGMGKINKGKKISTSRQVKYCDLLKIPLQYWNKSLTQITLKDIENFEKDISSGKVKSTFLNKEYSENTKRDINKMIKIYFRWRLGEERSIKLVEWLDTSTITKTPDFLNEKEIELLYRSCRNAKERYLVAVLFDTGARAEEFMNIRVEDIFLPEGNLEFVKIALKEEYSKTKGRTISLYWKNSLEAVRDYLRERKQEDIKPNEQIFTGNYDQMRMFLQRLGNKVLNKSIYPHLFRHSSATYFAGKLNRQQLCIRYGWTFSSNMPDVYISRAGVEDKELDEKFSNTKLEEVETDFKRKEEALRIEIEELKKTSFSMKEFIQELSKQEKRLGFKFNLKT